VALEGPGDTLLQTTFVLTLLLCLPLALAISAALLLFGREDLVFGSACYLVAWQLQEMARRSLLADLAHRTALVGDIITYMGQGAILISLALSGETTLPRALVAMAACASLGGAVQFRQAGILRPGRLAIVKTVREFISLGGWSLANGGLLALRYYLLSWTLAVLSGSAAAGQLQAAANVINMANPIILGLCNIIPQTAARAHHHGKERAWHAARPYVVIGAPPILLIYSLAFVTPAFLLWVIYGPSSPYIQLTVAVQVLAVASALSYGTDMICAYLHGVDQARTALVINGAGALVSVLVAAPTAYAFGVTGVCVALLAANLVRLLLSQVLLFRILAHDRLRFN
jgi:O-antigen/teichoic acid export membrane protein